MRTIGAIFLAIGRGLDWLRKFLHLILLLHHLRLHHRRAARVDPEGAAKAALVIAPEGEIVDQLSGDPIERAITQARGQGRSETLVWDLTDSIRAAAKDKRIPVHRHRHGVYRAAPASRRSKSCRRRLREFRATGKKVIAYGTAFEKPQYYLAAQADEIYVDPLGMVLIDGYEGYHVLQGPARQGRHGHQRVPRRRVQERRGAVTRARTCRPKRAKKPWSI